GHRGVEADLAHGMAGGAKTEAFQHSAIGKYEQRGRLGIVPAALRAAGTFTMRRAPGGCSAGLLLLRHRFSYHGLLVAYSVCRSNTRPVLATAIFVGKGRISGVDR